MLEREVKLRFDTADAARAAVLAPHVGARPLRARRLQHDVLFDDRDRGLAARRCALRVRREGEHVVLTFKGPPQPGAVKIREEHEVAVSDSATLLVILHELGFAVDFRYEKFREEFAVAGAVLAVDETPLGTFVEVEGSEAAIEQTARALGRQSTDYITASYRSLFFDHCQARGIPDTEMVFPPLLLRSFGATGPRT